MKLTVSSRYSTNHWCVPERVVFIVYQLTSTLAITRAHMKVCRKGSHFLDQANASKATRARTECEGGPSVNKHQYQLDCSQLTPNSIPDGKVCLNETGELAVTKFAVEPVSFLRYS